MKKVNPLHIQALLDLINHGPYFELLSMEVKALSNGYSRVEVNLENKHRNPFGGIHGGVYSSLIDTAAYWAVYWNINEDAGFVSLDVQVDNLAAVKDGHLVVEGKRIKVGRSICKAEAVIKDANGKYVAHGTSKMMITPGLQTINQAVMAMGHNALPPKFIS
ncbi:MAG: PaaI family thioesterase [Syntrophomonadaceae bacterium]|nr:PaaI family thioesterase [Syntrophomonadaceae bacterium]MDD3023704.1 PaaI family thioesterase [Syntrophomonadaceae bacterium]